MTADALADVLDSIARAIRSLPSGAQPTPRFEGCG
jgi:hypothetical protein